MAGTPHTALNNSHRAFFRDPLERARLEGAGLDVVLTKSYTVAQLQHALVQSVARPSEGSHVHLYVPAASSGILTGNQRGP